MQTIRQLGALRAAIAELRRDGGGIAFVPTMGALHDGHMSLVTAARRHAEHVVVSIFVNPLQFGVNEDLDAYPRQEGADAAKLEAAGVALLWAPDVATMYPDGHATRVSVSGYDEVLCGAARPGHFDGVTTVVAKLFHQVQPDVALFGEKDWQQLTIIRRMARDLDFALTVEGVPTVRDPVDGLAMSSRNAYLSPEQRAAAAAIPAQLDAAAEAIQGGAAPTAACAQAAEALLRHGFKSVDYFELRSQDNLALTGEVDPSARLFVAARMDGTRLIDNRPLIGPDIVPKRMDI